MAGDFNIDAIADHAVADAFGYLCDTLPQESDEYRQMMATLSGGGGGGGIGMVDRGVAAALGGPSAGVVRDLLKEASGHHPSTRPPRLQFPHKSEYIFKHKYPQRLDYLFFCDADCVRPSASPVSPQLVPRDRPSSPELTRDGPRVGRLAARHILRRAPRGDALLLHAPLGPLRHRNHARHRERLLLAG